MVIAGWLDKAFGGIRSKGVAVVYQRTNRR